MSLRNLFESVLESDQMIENAAMCHYTFFKIGGPAEFLVLPRTTKQIEAVVKLCRANNVPLFVMGNGSNLLVSDAGIEGVVLKIARGFDRVSINGKTATAEAGVTLSALADAAQNAGLSGLEFAAGIPGCLGGALFMNAGAYGSEMKDVVSSVVALDTNGGIKRLRNEDMAFAYRASAAQKDGLVLLSAAFALQEGDPEQIAAKTRGLNQKRRDSQPLELPSAGSTFKRPEGHYAGKLIMEAGLRGFTIGGAAVSEKHCGFVVNKGDATARDVLDVINHVRQTVFEQFGVMLEPEVRLVGRGQELI